MTRHPRFAAFTPIFSRCHTVDFVHESLASQSSRDVERIVVDGGSRDDTSSHREMLKLRLRGIRMSLVSAGAPLRPFLERA